MTRYSEFKTSQKNLVPPSNLRTELERQVMRDIDALPALRRRRRLLIATGAGVCVALLFLVLAPLRKPPTMAGGDFIESVVITEDHVFIWLEPATSKSVTKHD